LAKSTDGAATINAPTYAGTTSVLAGTLTFTGGLPGGAYAISGGTLDISGLSKSIGSLILTNGAVINGTGTLTSSAAYNLQNGTINARLGGSIGINKSNTGTVSLTRSLPGGSYSISGGTLNINNLSQTITALHLTSGGILGGTGTLTNNTAAYDIQYGTVNAILAGSVGLSKTSSGSATVNAPTYTGTTSVQAGTLTITGALPGGNYAVSGGTLNLGSLSKSVAGYQITAGTVAGTGTLSSGVNFDVQGGLTQTVLGGLSGLTKSGSGVAVLSAANTYSGPTQINAGMLALTATGQISADSAVTNNAGLLVADGTHTLGTINGNGATLVGNGATLTASSIVQDTLTIGGDYRSILAQCNAGPAAADAATTVPEPSSLLLLASCLAGLAFAITRRRK
jgi:autotransporter-associated beta strand protein